MIRFFLIATLRHRKGRFTLIGRAGIHALIVNFFSVLFGPIEET